MAGLVAIFDRNLVNLSFAPNHPAPVFFVARRVACATGPATDPVEKAARLLTHSAGLDVGNVQYTNRLPFGATEPGLVRPFARGWLSTGSSCLLAVQAVWQGLHLALTYAGEWPGMAADARPGRLRSSDTSASLAAAFRIGDLAAFEHRRRAIRLATKDQRELVRRKKGGTAALSTAASNPLQPLRVRHMTSKIRGGQAGEFGTVP